MESSSRDSTINPCPHHHHHHHHHHRHHHHHSHCYLHPLIHHRHHNHSHCSSNQHANPRLAHLPHFHNPVPVAHVTWPRASDSEGSLPAPACDSRSLVYEQHEHVELEEEDDEEPIFVLTDEWKEFFAKSEAKRKLEKKQAKKNGKA